MTQETDPRGLVSLLSDSTDVTLIQYQSLLRAAGIDAVVEGGLQELSMFGVNLHPYGEGPVLKVPAEQVERARELLCENGVVCAVPEGGVERIIERVVRPLLAAPERDTQRLRALLDGLSKDFRAALFHEILSLPDGQALLESVLHDALRDDEAEEPLRRDLCQALAGATPDLTCRRLASQAKAATPAVRVRLARSLARFPCQMAATTLAGLLVDPELAVRDEALEGLFALSRGKSFGFDPEASPEAAAGAAARWRAWAEAYRP